LFWLGLFVPQVGAPGTDNDWLDEDAFFHLPLDLLDPWAEQPQELLLAAALGMHAEALRAHKPLPAEELSLQPDREGLIRMVVNLLDNAIKFSPRGGRVAVSLARKHGAVCLEVQDQGSSIAEALHERVFDCFCRVPAQRQEGSGLGLIRIGQRVDRRRPTHGPADT
jgi:signal transduction histidine kinase